MAAPVELEHRALQAFVVGGVHLFNGKAAPRLVLKNNLHRLGVALEHADIVDHIGGQVILGRGLLFDPVLTGNEAGENGAPVRAGGLGPGLGTHIGVSVADAEGCALQRHAFVTGLMLVNFQGAGFGVVDKAYFHDVDRLVGCDRDGFRRAVHHIAGGGGDFGDSDIHLGLPLRDGDDNGFAAVGDLHRIIDVSIALHLEDGPAQGAIGISIVFHDSEVSQGRVVLGCFRSVGRRGNEVAGKGHIAIGRDTLGRAGRGFGLLAAVPEDKAGAFSAAMPFHKRIVIRFAARCDGQSVSTD